MEITYEENEIQCRRYSIGYRRQPCACSGRCNPEGLGTAAFAVSEQKLLARAGFRAPLSGKALRLEHRSGQVERGRHRAIAPAFGELVSKTRGSRSPEAIQSLEDEEAIFLRERSHFLRRRKQPETEKRSNRR
jgi:hypothetical protein